jgi:hypothetical protein
MLRGSRAYFKPKSALAIAGQVKALTAPTGLRHSPEFMIDKGSAFILNNPVLTTDDHNLTWFSLLTGESEVK